jgi:hypothetical protein
VELTVHVAAEPAEAKQIVAKKRFSSLTFIEVVGSRLAASLVEKSGAASGLKM